MELFVKVRGFTFAAESELPARVVQANHIRANDRQRSEPRSYPWWTIDCMKTGSPGRKTVAGLGSWRREPGWVHLHRPGVVFADDNSRETEIHDASYIHFTGGELLGLDRLTGRDGFAAIHDPAAEVHRRLTRMALTGETRGNSGALLVAAMLYELADFLLTHAEHRDGVTWRLTAAPRPSGDFGARLRDYFERHYRRELNLEEIARAMQVSVSTLSHRCRSETGLGPKALLTAIRIEQSKPLLLRGLPLKRIAGSVGLGDDEFHFSRVFKRVTGMPPSEYRRTVRIAD